MPLRDREGFTLIELLVALSIVAVLMAILYETFNAVLRSTRQVDEATEIDQMARSSLGIMANELRSAYWRPPSGSTSFLFIGEDGLSGARPSDTLKFTTLSHARVSEGIMDPTLSAVKYELMAVPDTGMAVLMHGEETNLLSEKSLERYELAERVIGLNFRYFDGKEWADEWNADAQDQRKLPKAVEIQIFFLDPSGRERQFTTQTDIPVGQTS